jgi:aspartyl-tRNA(Asn)/glutamyl-tRNA(Gln) amidotransferase subunit A
MELKNLTIKKAHQGLVKKEFSSWELTQEFFKTIQEKDKNILAYLILTQELALEQAKICDKKIQDGQKINILEGLPTAIKDNILVKNIKCTAGSKILANYFASYDATIVSKLKDQGAVFLGKTNLDEFAMGSSTENSVYQITKNPNDLERVPGGSSGGSAAAVASDQCVYALGSDTGGSIRQPASFCGVVGLKPTYGAVSRYGLISMASSLDQIGPLAKTSEDAEIIFQAIKGYDKFDATSTDFLEKDFSFIDFKKVKIGLPKEYFSQGLDPEVGATIQKAIRWYQSQGAEILDISLPHSEFALACYYIIMPAEVSANLARYDGIKYGLSESEDALLDVYLKSRQNCFGPEVRRRIMLGTYTLSAGYYDAYYLKAQKVRTLIKKDFEDAFKKVDVIIGPVSPTTAFKIGEKTEDPLEMYLSDIYTVSINLAGVPALSLPCGQVNNLSVGLQIIGNYFEESKILAIAKKFEESNKK